MLVTCLCLAERAYSLPEHSREKRQDARRARVPRSRERVCASVLPPREPSGEKINKVFIIFVTMRTKTRIKRCSCKCQMKKPPSRFCSVSHWDELFLLVCVSRIQEEEWDKYIVPSKAEPEKCKVSRTFSFLMNRMTSSRNKCKVI